MNPIRVAVAAGLLSLVLPSAAAAASPEVQAEARAMLEKMVSFETTADGGGTPAMAAWLRDGFVAAGFAPGDIEIVPVGNTVGMLVHYRPAAGTTTPPVVFLAHMDVVTVQRDDWASDPWVLTERDGALYGRGVVDNKYGVLTVAQAFMRLKREGFVPDRELVAAFTGDEETGMKTTALLAERLQGAAYALNADAGGGFINDDGSTYYVYQAAEKTYATFELTVKNPGGHSSIPRTDNAIYQLADALRRLAPHRFPVKWNDISLSSLASQVDSFPPEIGEAIVQFVEVPGDPAAVAVLETDPVVNRELRTTCVATMLRAGTAENALPASATATVNCRIFPGETIAETQAELQRVVADPAIAFKVLDDPVESPASELPEEALAALKAVIARRAPGAPVAPYQEAGGTDGLHFRRAGIPTIGVGGLFASPESDYGFHGNDERLPLAEFAAGLDHFHGLISALAGGDDPA